MFIKSLNGKWKVICKHLFISVIIISVLLISAFQSTFTSSNYEMIMLIIGITVASLIWATLIIIVLHPKITFEDATICSISSMAAIIYHPVLWSYMFYRSAGLSDELLTPFFLFQLLSIITCLILVPISKVLKYVFAIMTAFLADICIIFFMFISYPGGDL